MAIERLYSLSAAARVLGKDRKTLKRLLLTELQMVLPTIRRGSHQMIRESVLERLIDKRGPRVDYRLLRGSKKIHAA